ncbi:unnamed protein product [Penicillium salamii]|nr:unnamed protein product [Penicillium salamii]CAG8348546.1 unnamed protein product [Penicillium salamii]
MSCLSSSRARCLTPSRIFLFLGLAATLLLLSYQLILYRSTEELGVLVGNESPNTESVSAPEPPLSTTESVKQQPTPEPTPEPIPESIPEPAPAPTKELVFAAMEASNMSWVEEHLPEWTANIYRADASQGLTVPINKGNEAMVYLTYIIDRYWSLPDVSIFLHGGRYQWHVDNPLYDSVISIQDLQSDYVLESGYVSLRCAWSVGCPRELEPARYLRERPDDSHHPAAMEYPDRFMELFPRAEVPEEVGAPCCSQFALSRGKIREQSLEHYLRLQRWLIETELSSGISGRIFEYSWHMIFGKPTQYCLDQKDCYCRTYGYCNMTDAEMQSQWVWRGLKLPEGWPESAPEPEPVPNSATPTGQAEKQESNISG